MIYEILLVLLIIGFSALFKVGNKLGIDSQLSFICLTLMLIIIYKALLYFRMQKSLSKENFASFTQEINDFISKSTPTGSTPQDIHTYKNEISKLQDKVDVMNEYLSELNNVAKGQATDNITAYDELNLQASQQIQDYRIKQLRQNIQETTDLIKKAKLRDDAKNFKKIPIYSSCIVSNADGSTSVDTPSSTIGSNNMSSQNTDGNSVMNNVVSQLQNLQTSRNGSTSNNLQVLNNNNQMANLLNEMMTRGVDINLNT